MMKQNRRRIARAALLVALLLGAPSIPGHIDGANAIAPNADARVACNPCLRQPGIGGCCRYIAPGLDPMAAQHTILDGDIPLAAGLDADGDGEIDIYADIENPKNGDIVTLSTALSTISNDAGLLCQWFVNRGDGRGYTAIDGATGKTYSYTYSDAFARHRFRVQLSVPQSSGE